MTKNQRARRVAILCCHCVRNAAYYRAGWRRNSISVSEDFWVNANGNFLDLAVLEWCKLFTDRRGKHHWRKVVPDPNVFLPGLLKEIGVDEQEFQDRCKEIKTYRDKFVAHLDDKPKMQIPHLSMVIDSVIYLYSIVRDEFDAVLNDAPGNLRSFYRQRFAHAKSHYENAT